MRAVAENDEASSNVVAFPPRTGGPAAIDAEAARRIRRLEYDRWLMRERVIGVPVPAPIRYLKMQIEFAAEAMKALDPVPDNFRADCFWPS